MFGKNNSNLGRLISFDEVMRRIRKAAFEYDEGLNKNWSDEIFYARDRNNIIADVRRDGENTAHVSVGPAYLNDVPIDSITAILGEYGFDYRHAPWIEDYERKIQEGDESGYIYIIQMEGSNLYKIGRTKHHKSRLALLGVLMPKPADFVGVWEVKAMRTVERMIHEDFGVFHSNGEWFDIPDTSKLLGYLNETYKRVK